MGSPQTESNYPQGVRPVVVILFGGRRQMEPHLERVVGQEADEEHWHRLDNSYYDTGRWKWNGN